MSLDSRPENDRQAFSPDQPTGFVPTAPIDSVIDRIEQVCAAIDEAIQAYQRNENFSSDGERRLVFIDTRVEDVEAHLRLISEATLYWIDEETDGVAEIGRVLSACDQISEVHIVAPAWDERLPLGAADLGPELPSSRRAELLRWSRPMTRASQIIVHGYGTETGTSPEVLRRLSELIGIECIVAEPVGSTTKARTPAEVPPGHVSPPGIHHPGDLPNTEFLV